MYTHVVTDLPNVEDCCELLASFLPSDISTYIRFAYIEDDIEAVEKHGGKESATREMTFQILTEWHLDIFWTYSLNQCCLGCLRVVWRSISGIKLVVGMLSGAHGE